MKRLFTYLLTVVVALFALEGCSDSGDYEELLDAENEAIASYISRNNIDVVTSYPADSVWGANTWLRTKDGVYIHIDDLGDQSVSVSNGCDIVLAYMKEGLDGEIVSDYTNAPIKSWYGYISTSYEYTSSGIHAALTIMRHHLCHAHVLVPSKQACYTDMNYVEPYIYDITLRIP